MTAPRPVLVEWEDSAQPSPEWTFIDDIPEEPGILVIRSLGWLVKRDETELRVALALGGTPDNGNQQVSGVAAIPASCVKNLHFLGLSLSAA